MEPIGKNGLLFYNCLFMIPPAIIVFFMTEDLSRIIGERPPEGIMILSFKIMYFKSLKDGKT